MLQATGPPSIVRPSCWVKVGRASNFTVLHNLSQLSSSPCPVQTHLKYLTCNACLVSYQGVLWCADLPFTIHLTSHFHCIAEARGTPLATQQTFQCFQLNFLVDKSVLRHILMASRIVKPVISVWSPCGLLVLCDSFLWFPDVSQFINFPTLLE